MSAHTSCWLAAAIKAQNPTSASDPLLGSQARADRRTLTLLGHAEAHRQKRINTYS